MSPKNDRLFFSQLIRGHPVGRVLGIDWDGREFRVIEATIGRGTLEIERALVLSMEREPSANDPAAVGRFLRSRLDALGISTRAVRACLGRSQAFFRSYTLPAVPDEELPALVRFQVVKELSFPGEQAIIDFALASPEVNGSGTNTRQVLAAALRPELFAACQTSLEAAGLKLQALGLRPFAIARALAHVLGRKADVTGPSAELVLAIGAEATELAVVRGDDLVYSRALKRLDARALDGDRSPEGKIDHQDSTDDKQAFSQGPAQASDAGGETLNALVSEVRRSLAAYSSQFPQWPVQQVYLLGGVTIERRLSEELRRSLGLPVESVDPLAKLSFSGPRPEDPGAPGWPGQARP